MRRLFREPASSRPLRRNSTARSLVPSELCLVRATTPELVSPPLYAPGFYTGYDVKTLPGVREAIEQKQWRSARRDHGTANALLHWRGH